MPPTIEYQRPAIPAAVVARLEGVLGENAVLSHPAELLPYETDAMVLHRGRPALVLLPATTEETIAILKILHATGVPWVPRGAGTGLSGGAVAAAGEVVISLARLRRVLAVAASARRAQVEPGVVNLQLNAAVAKYGLHFAPDPSSQMAATIGGNIAENAGGAHTLKHGVAAQHLLGLRLLLPDGTALQIGQGEEVMAGYDLLGLLAGSEGTLGLICEATLRLLPCPEETCSFLAVFGSVAAASAAVEAILGAGVVPAALEMIDAEVLAALEAATPANLPLDAGALLIGELDGLRETVVCERRLVEAALSKCELREVRYAAAPGERERLWAARKKAFGALGRVAPNYISHDAVIPRSTLPRVLARIAEVGRRHRLRIANIFHAGDGNLHPAILCDETDHDLMERAAAAGEEIQRICLDAGGVLTGEHGIGLSMRAAMRWVFTPDELALMDRLRRGFDPAGHVNPGKILPPGGAAPGVVDAIDSDGVGRARATGLEQKGDAPSEAEEDSSSPSDPGARPRRALSTLESELRDALLDANRNRLRIAPVAAGTLRLAPPPPEGEGQVRQIDLCGQSRLLSYQAADFAMTVEAGITVGEAAAAAEREGQRLAWEAPDPGRATLGGIVSAGYWGDLTLGLGHPRHSLLGLRAITGEGAVIEFGAPVVKDVSGYDVAKLLVGARGTLAVLTRLVLRTYPMPREWAHATARGDYRALLALADHLASLPLGWSLFDLHWDTAGAVLLIGLDGHRAEVTRRWDALRRAAGEVAAAEGRLAEEIELSQVCGAESRTQRQAAADVLRWQESALILRIVTTPERTARLVERVRALCAEEEGSSWAHRLQCHPGIGLVRIAFDPGYRAVTLRRLLLSIAGAVRELDGYRALDCAPAHPWWGWDAWGAPPMLGERMRRIRAAFDPHGVLMPWQPDDAVGGQ